MDKRYWFAKITAWSAILESIEIKASLEYEQHKITGVRAKLCTQKSTAGGQKRVLS